MNRLTRTTFTALLGATLLSGCATYSSHAEEFDKLAAAADADIQAVNKTGFTWRDTEKFLKEARAAKANADQLAAAGDSDKANAELNTAMALAKKAQAEAQLALKQSQDQANPVTIFKP